MLCVQSECSRGALTTPIHPSINPSIGRHIHRAPQAKKGGKVKGGKGGKGENGKVGAGLSGATRLRSCMYVYEVYG